MPVDTENLLNSAIDARAANEAERQRIAARRGEIVRQLANLHGGRRNRGQMASLQAELAGLGEATRNLNAQERATMQAAQLRAHSAFQNAHLATQTAKLARDEQTANQVANIMNGVVRLQAKYPNRIYDPNQAAAFHSEMEKLTTDNAAGMRNESAAATVRQATTFHDQERQKAMDKAAAGLGVIGVTTNDFMNRDRSKDFATEKKTLGELNQATSTAKEGKPEKAGSETGDYIHFMVGKNQHLVKKEDFAKWNALFTQQKIGESAPVGDTVNYNVPATPLPKGQTYAISGTNQPAHPGDYWTQELPGGLLQKNFASGGSATITNPTTPEGAARTEAAQTLTAARKDYFDTNQAGTTGVVGQPPANISPVGGAVGTPVTDQLVAQGKVSLEKSNAAPPSDVAPGLQSAQPVAQENPLSAPTNPSERVVGQMYDTPKGRLRWSGTGWTPLE